MKLSGRIAARDEGSKPTLPEIGRVKIGEKQRNGSGTEFPASLDYFKATGKFAQMFHNILGDKPNSITIAFISDDVSQVCNERLESWSGGRRYGYGDGVVFNIAEKDAKGQYIWSEVSLIKPDGTEDRDVKKRLAAIHKIGEWKRTLTLKFIVLKLKNVIGHWTLETKAAKTTIPMVVGAFDLVREKSNTIIGFPFTLMVEKVKGYSPGAPRSYPIVKLVPNFTEENMQTVRDYIEAGNSPLLLNANKLLSENNNNL